MWVQKNHLLQRLERVVGARHGRGRLLELRSRGGRRRGEGWLLRGRRPGGAGQGRWSGAWRLGPRGRLALRHRHARVRRERWSDADGRLRRPHGAVAAHAVGRRHVVDGGADGWWALHHGGPGGAVAGRPVVPGAGWLGVRSGRALVGGGWGRVPGPVTHVGGGPGVRLLPRVRPGAVRHGAVAVAATAVLLLLLLARGWSVRRGW